MIFIGINSYLKVIVVDLAVEGGENAIFKIGVVSQVADFSGATIMWFVIHYTNLFEEKCIPEYFDFGE